MVESTENQEEEKRELVATTSTYEQLWDKWSDDEKKARQEELLAQAVALPTFNDRKDQFRDPERASYYGGFELRDPV